MDQFSLQLDIPRVLGGMTKNLYHRDLGGFTAYHSIMASFIIMFFLVNNEITTAHSLEQVWIY